MALNKRILLIASSLAAIPLTIALIAAASHRGRKHKLLQSKGFLEQTNPKTSVITTIPVHREQQKEKSKAQPNSAWQGSETRAATMTTTATISTSTTGAYKDVFTAPRVAPSPVVPSSTSDIEVIVSSSSPQTSKEEKEEISLSDEARKTGESLKEQVVTAIKEARDSAMGTGIGKQLKEQTIDIAAKADSKDIHSLRDNVNVSVGLFEEMMIEIRKECYNEQIKLLDSYKDLLQTHIKVANARRRMASKLKPGA